ncbi:hypothetical protein Efla_003721 [Eimeria flavescens]
MHRHHSRAAAEVCAPLLAAAAAPQLLLLLQLQECACSSSTDCSSNSSVMTSPRHRADATMTSFESLLTSAFPCLPRAALMVYTQLETHSDKTRKTSAYVRTSPRRAFKGHSSFVRRIVLCSWNSLGSSVIRPTACRRQSGSPSEEEEAEEEAEEEKEDRGKMNALDYCAEAANQRAAAAAAREPLEISSRHGRGGFNPYVNNGGTVLCVAGEDFVIGVGDTRLSLGYSIQSRMQSKITQLTSQCGIASSGMQADIQTLHKLLKLRMIVSTLLLRGRLSAIHLQFRIKSKKASADACGEAARVAMFKHQHREEPSVVAVAQLLSTILYSRRFFPYYTFNVLFGLDAEGKSACLFVVVGLSVGLPLFVRKGAVFGYDAIGSFERAMYNCAGTGSQLTMSILDNQIAQNNQQKPRPKMTKEETVALVRGVLASAGERDIFTGDQAEVVLIDAHGVHSEFVPLRND